MKKEDLGFIHTAISNAINIAMAEVTICEANDIKPATVKVYKEDLIPQLEKSLELIKTEYYATN